ncbi:uncharacterized protein LOC108090067 isoform X2 [Drosophila ficusphila]|uniref:uncharacterized protein LOC108090067 isoform X2 n=1 Tax=Drosophila ficusphila TaxID=30025 RepID=UPI001C89F91E|nr:uncharacterized protein LOC108090067 isoform X2 [Drosophila ficusphila]
MENFLQDLVTPQKFSEKLTESYLSNEELSGDIVLGHDSLMVKCNDENDRVPIDPRVFVRRKSIKEQLAKKKEKKEEDARSMARKSSVNPQQSVLSSRLTRQSEAERTRTSLQPKESTFTKQESQLYLGLAPNHPMLEGYNLDDTRQTIKCKTSKYFFEEGRIVLYEEKWNFRQMNKCLALEIGGQEVHFRSASDPLGVTAADSSVRIESKNGISLRVMPMESECAKVVLNYPNGLSTYCHDTHSEHLWQYQDNELDEIRRICTPYGCVIVFYQNTDTILIMRYNGEVYQLYSSTAAENEEEEDPSPEFINACSTQSTYTTYEPLREPKKKQRSNAPSSQKSSVVRNSGGMDSVLRPSKQSLGSKVSKKSVNSNLGGRRSRILKNQQAVALFESIKFELNFLNFIMALYKLSYRYLKLTTSLGSVVNVQLDGKIWCGKPFRNTEWHDYYANESYSMRDDGVKIIWTKDEIRCYHTDGTVITSGTIEGWETSSDTDEMDFEISSSSSHINAINSDSFNGRGETMFINAPDGLPFEKVSHETLKVEEVEFQSPNASNRKLSSQSEVIIEEEEGEVYFDRIFITFMPNSFMINHKIYAGIHFSFSHITEVDLNLETSIFTCDNMNVRVFKYAMPLEATQLDPPEPMSSEADPDEWTKPKVKEPSLIPDSDVLSDEIPTSGEEQKSESLDLVLHTCVEVECNNLRLILFDDRVTIQTRIRKFGCDENAKCNLQVHDDIELKVNFAENLLTTFRKWIDELTSFINCFCPKRRSLYFLETQNKSCQKKGFELLKTVPPLGKYNFCAGNYFIDVSQLRSVDNQMKNKYDWFDKDMEKFPRFPLIRKPPQQEEDFPMVLDAKIFVEIPAQLANTDRIHQFVTEFDAIKFRKQRYRFNDSAGDEQTQLEESP